MLFISLFMSLLNLQRHRFLVKLGHKTYPGGIQRSNQYHSNIRCERGRKLVLWCCGDVMKLHLLHCAALEGTVRTGVSWTWRGFVPERFQLRLWPQNHFGCKLHITTKQHHYFWSGKHRSIAARVPNIIKLAKLYKLSVQLATKSGSIRQLRWSKKQDSSFSDWVALSRQGNS